jgi:hypothetical protein
VLIHQLVKPTYSYLDTGNLLIYLSNYEGAQFSAFARFNHVLPLIRSCTQCWALHLGQTASMGSRSARYWDRNPAGILPSGRVSRASARRSRRSVRRRRFPGINDGQRGREGGRKHTKHSPHVRVVRPLNPTKTSGGRCRRHLRHWRR